MSETLHCGRNSHSRIWGPADVDTLVSAAVQSLDGGDTSGDLYVGGHLEVDGNLTLGSDTLHLDIRAGDDLDQIRITGEGRILGEVGTLSGIERTATLRASGPAIAIVLNEAELERFLTMNPAMALRVIRSMAHRLATARTNEKDD